MADSGDTNKAPSLDQAAAMTTTDAMTAPSNGCSDLEVRELLEQAVFMQSSLDTRELVQKVALLNAHLESAQAELQNTLVKLDRIQRLYDKATCYNLDMKKQLVDLTVDLVRFKQAAEVKGQAIYMDQSSQTEEPYPATHTCDGIAGGEGDNQSTTGAPQEANQADWGQTTSIVDQEETPISIADSIKAAAEAAMHHSGYVYDEKTGLYYDYSSGYYYDSEKNLHYEPNTGTYYFFNTDTQQYEFHSQVDVSQYKQDGSQKPPSSYKPSHSHSHKPHKYSSKSGEHRGHGKVSPSRESKHQSKRRGEADDDREPIKRKRSRSVERRHGRREGKSHKSSHCHKDRKPKKSSNRSPSRKREKSTSSSNKSSRKKDSNSRNEQKNVKAAVADGCDIRDEVNDEDKSSREEGQTEECRAVVEDEEEGEDGELEEGELSSGSGVDSSKPDVLDEQSGSSDGEMSDGDKETDVINDENSMSLEEEEAASYRPCIRAIVMKSQHLDLGSLFILTCTGGTIGREAELNHTIHIPDEHVSKMHCEIIYGEELQRYTISDRASQSGTFVNKKRLSKPKVVSGPCVLYNGDSLQVGRTMFDLHIHPGTSTCDGCEPGIIQARLQEEALAEANAVAKPDKEKLRRQELKMIKKKFGLQDSAYVDDASAINNPKYTDKASERRRVKGSDNPYQRDDAPASVERAISNENKGHKMLAKMGWKDGESLGKMPGITEPIKVSLRPKASAGLGAYSSLEQSIDNIKDIRHTERWIKTQERYQKIAKVESVASGDVEGVDQKQWDQGETQNE